MFKETEKAWTMELRKKCRTSTILFFIVETVSSIMDP
jgi:hypothetical protein